MLRIATVNVNGIRAAYRKGMGTWLADRGVDVVGVQEVRAPDDVIRGLVHPSGLHLAHSEAADKGRSGVAVLTHRAPGSVRTGIGDDYFDDAGRWIEADVELASGKRLTVASAYAHSGEVGTAKQDDKYRFLDAMLVRLRELREESDYAVVLGDLNIGHSELDIKNWKGNVDRAGFLTEERAYLDLVFGDLGWVDVGRAHAGPVDGPYTWWSYRGKAFDNDAGWRLDYQVATPELAALVTDCAVDRAPSYDRRWSDHAPLVVDYDA